MAQANVAGSEAPPQPICLRCARPVDPLQNFCLQCGAPRGYAASLPFEYYLVLGQSLGLIFRRACLTRGVPLRRRALDVLVLLLVFPGTVLISLLLVVPGSLWRLLRGRKSPQARAR